MISITCKLLQGKAVVCYMESIIILDYQINTHDSFVARVNFLQATSDEMTQSAAAPCKKNDNNLHAELGHPSKSISHATAKALGIQVTSTFNL